MLNLFPLIHITVSIDFQVFVQYNFNNCSRIAHIWPVRLSLYSQASIQNFKVMKCQINRFRGKNRKYGDGFSVMEFVTFI